MLHSSLLQKFVVTSATALVLVNSAQAALNIDLRFAPGIYSDAKTYWLSPTNKFVPVTIQAWAAVTGITGNSSEEGLQSSILAIKSIDHAANVTGGIISASRGASWNGAGSGDGEASNLSADGIGDWGNTSNTGLILHSSFFRARTTKSLNNLVDWGDSDSAGIYNNLPDGSAEFLIGTFTFLLTADNGFGLRTLEYVPVVPLGGSIGPAFWFEDTVSKLPLAPTGVKSSISGTLGPLTPNTAGTGGVTFFIVPEPISLGLVGLGMVGLMRRRRNEKLCLPARTTVSAT